MLKCEFLVLAYKFEIIIHLLDHNREATVNH